MRIQLVCAVALSAVLGLSLLATSTLAEDQAGADKITFKLRSAKGSTYKLTTKVALATKMQPPTAPGAGIVATSALPVAAPAGKVVDGLVTTPQPQPSGVPALPAPAPSAVIGMEMSASAVLVDAYRVEAADGNGACLLQPTLAPPEVKVVPLPLGFDAGNAAARAISPLLKLQVTPGPQAEVTGLAEFAKSVKDAGPNGGHLSIEAQIKELKTHLQLATYWMPKQAVGIGESWPIKLQITFPGAEELSAPITGTCTLTSRDHGKATLVVKGGATGTLTVDEASGWLLLSDLHVNMPGANPCKVIHGRITQRSGQ